MKTISQQDVEHDLIVMTRQLLDESGMTYKREIGLDNNLQSHLGIDSLGRSELFQRIEKKFSIQLPDSLLMQAETLRDIEKFILKTEDSPAAVAPIPTVGPYQDEPANVDPSQAASLIDVLLLYAEKTPNKVHIYFQHEDHEQPVTYGELLKNSLRAAEGLRRAGLMEGETVAIMQPTHPNFFYVFLGTLMAGGIPVPIYPPFRMNMLETYAKTEAQILRSAQVRMLITFDQAEKLSQHLKSFVPDLKQVLTAEELMGTDELKTIFHARENHPAFIQYTSGSTSNPKGVLLNHANLLTNIQTYCKSIHAAPTDVAVSWLPLYHDMGLIGMWLGSLYAGVPLVLLTPFAFLNHPEKWLWAIHRHRGTVTGAPNFAYELCVRKIDPERIKGLDLSSLRIAANGAEKIYPKTLEDFAKKFAPYGFNKLALMPVYGLAESTVALTIPPVNRGVVVDSVDRKQFENERRAQPTQANDALEFVACGTAMENHQIRIVDDNNQELPDRTVGNLQFCGPSSMQGYYNNPEATKKIFHDGWWDTGDLGYVVNGELFITGRRKDLIIRAGRNLYPAEIEEFVGTVAGVRHGCVAAFAVNDAQKHTEKLVVVAETREPQSRHEEIVTKINETLANTLNITPDQVVLVAPHIVPKTSSGKLQRSKCKQLYLTNRLRRGRAPQSLQIFKLITKSFFHKFLGVAKQTAKVVYTLYMALLVLLTFFPIFFFVKYTNRDTGAKAVKKWSSWLLMMGFCKITLVHAERLQACATMIYAPNHCSYIDALFMVAVLPWQTRFVVKKELFSIPIVRTGLKKLEHLGVDRMDLTQGLADTRNIENVLKAGHPILIFPEGTFSYAPGLRPFRLGAFKISVDTKVPVCPIAINGTRYILRDIEKVMEPHKVTITAGDIIYPQGIEWEHVTQSRNAVRAEILKYCGEPSLDFIAASPVAPTRVKST